MSESAGTSNEISILRRELASYRAEAQTLMSAALLLNTTLDLKHLLRIILEQSARIAGAEASSLALVDQTPERELIFEVSVGESSDVMETIRLPWGTGVIGWVIANDEAVVIPDCSKDPRFFSKVDQQTSFVTRSIIAVPLRTKRGVIGGVEVLNKAEGGAFGEEDLRVLTGLAAQAALAIENARLYSSMLEERNRIQSIVTSIADGIIVTDHNHEIILANPSAQQIWDLNSRSSLFKLNAVMEELLSDRDEDCGDLVLMKPEGLILSNKVTTLRDVAGRDNGHVISCRNVTDLKERENRRMVFINLLAGRTVENLDRFAARFKPGGEERQKLEEAIALARKFSYFGDLVSGPVRLNRFRHSADDLLAVARKRLAATIARQEERIRILLDTPRLELDVDEERFGDCLAVVLDNALRYSSVRTPVKVHVGADDENAVFRIHDQGVGMTPREQEDVFNLERLFDETPGGYGFSLGLLYVRHVVDAHGGKVMIQSEIGRGTCVTLTLPLFIH